MDTEQPPSEGQQQQNGGGSPTHNSESPRGDVKNVYIYKNGDPFYRPHRITVNTKQFRNYEAFLTQVTTTIKPRFGCVRKLHTPEHGHRVRDIENLEPGKAYVAAGIESFAKLPYKDIPEKEQKQKTNPKVQQPITPVYHSRIQVSARVRKNRPEPITIFVFENGNELKAPARILLTPRELDGWEQILSAVSDRVTLSKGAVRMLFSLSGQRILEPAHLKTGESYVAVAADGKFIATDYGSVRRPINTSPKLDRKRYERLELDGLKSKQSSNTRKARPGGRVQKKSSTGSGSGQEEDVFRNGGRQSSSSSKTKPADYDSKDDGPFKSNQENQDSRGAREVEDGDDTKVDLPIDQVEAEEVQDDETDKNKVEESPAPAEADSATDQAVDNETTEQENENAEVANEEQAKSPTNDEEQAKSPTNEEEESPQSQGDVEASNPPETEARTASRASNAGGEQAPDEEQKKQDDVTDEHDQQETSANAEAN